MISYGQHCLELDLVVHLNSTSGRHAQADKLVTTEKKK